MKHSVDKSLREAIRETKIISKMLDLGGTCLLCFENSPFVIEEHHLGGRKNCSIKVPLCANCHVLASKNQLNYDGIWSKADKPDVLKLLFVQKDLQYLQDRINQRIIDEINTN
jgi:hypothetical protein